MGSLDRERWVSGSWIRHTNRGVAPRALTSDSVEAIPLCTLPTDLPYYSCSSSQCLLSFSSHILSFSLILAPSLLLSLSLILPLPPLSHLSLILPLPPLSHLSLSVNQTRLQGGSAQPPHGPGSRYSPITLLPSDTVSLLAFHDRILAACDNALEICETEILGEG